MDKIRSILSQLEVFTPATGLSAKILLSIEREKQRIARIRLSVFSLLSLGSSFALVFIMPYAQEGFSHSGFTDYFSLLFSDTGTVLTFWKEFALSIVESLPFLEITALALFAFIFLCSLSLAAKNMRIAFLSTHHLRYGQ